MKSYSYSICSHKELSPICIHPCKQRQTTEKDGKHACTHCRVLALGAQTHINTVRASKNKHTNTGTQ